MKAVAEFEKVEGVLTIERQCVQPMSATNGCSLLFKLFISASSGSILMRRAGRFVRPFDSSHQWREFFICGVGFVEKFNPLEIS